MTDLSMTELSMTELSMAELSMARSHPAPVPDRAAITARRQRECLNERLPAPRARLEQHRRFRREQLAQLDAHARGHEFQEGRGRADDPDRGPVSALREVDAIVAAGARRALADIDVALGRMRTGRYGRCRECGDGIPLAVLEAVPKTTVCLGCQRRGEHGGDRERVRGRVPGR